jgi:hypothetical protein
MEAHRTRPPSRPANRPGVRAECAPAQGACVLACTRYASGVRHGRVSVRWRRTWSSYRQLTLGRHEWFTCPHSIRLTEGHGGKTALRALRKEVPTSSFQRRWRLQILHEGFDVTRPLMANMPAPVVPRLTQLVQNTPCRAAGVIGLHLSKQPGIEHADNPKLHQNEPCSIPSPYLIPVPFDGLHTREPV